MFVRIKKIQAVDQINLKALYKKETVNLDKVQPVNEIILKSIEIKNG